MEALEVNDLEGLEQNDVLGRQLSEKEYQLRQLSSRLVFPPSFQSAAGFGALGKHFIGGYQGLVVGALAGYFINKGKKMSDMDVKIIGKKILALRKEIEQIRKRIDSGDSAIEGIMSSEQLKAYDYDKYEFTGKWKKFVGEPQVNFAMMVFGLPKSGKSTYCMQFAKYLSNNFGKVLYIAAEEGYSITLQNKVKQFGSANDNVFFCNYREYEPIRELLIKNDFDFVFIDSVNYIRITPQQVEELKHENPQAAFITIQQATKDGKHKGEQEFAHNCDIIVKIDNGIAYHNGRFHEESFMEVFPPKEQNEVIRYADSEDDDEGESAQESGDDFDYGD
jgi:hypothetical protein